MRSLWIYLLVIFGTALIFQSIRTTSEDRIPYARFRELADQGQIADVEIRGDTYVAKTTTDPATGSKHTYRTGRIKESERDLLARLDENKVPYTLMTDEHTLLSPTMLLWLLPIGATIVVLALSTRKGGPPTITNPALSFGKNKARLYVDKGTPVTFGDVAGSEEAKAELAEVVEFLRSPERFRRLGARVPRGVLLVGPPGTGKTLLAKAVAGEAGVPFFSICGSEFVEMFVGVGAARVRDLFAQARERPASILFIDELDAVGKARGVGGSIGGNDEREQTLNQLLTEMDGFDSTSGLIVIGATNRPEILDAALLRPGRFDRRVHVDRPDLAERRAILEVHARRVRLGAVDLARVAGQTVGLAGADLANLMNEAALLAARRRADAVEQRDLEEAIERAIAGLPRRTRRLLPRERSVVAYHEAGHALCSALLPTQDPVRKISIVPRGPGALGYTIQAPVEDRYLMSRQEILDRLVVLLGGRVAEETVVGEVSTGAQDDLLTATDLARRMVRELGMSEVMGVVTFEPRPRSPSERWMGGAPDYSEETARAVDAEVARILADALARTRALIAENRDLLEQIAQRLLEAETMSGEELRAVVDVRPAAQA
jgi:cell division protease FtsH